MVWIKDIWYYFLNEEDIEKGYLNYLTELVDSVQNSNNIEIPKVFTRMELLREFIQINGDKKLIRIASKKNDEQLRVIYHCNYSFNYDSNNVYSQWIPFAKKKLFDYAEEWCWDNNFQCTKKDERFDSKFIYLDCL